MPDVYVDGDACPVKEEVARVALRHDLKVFVVSHGRLSVPSRGRVEHVRVKQGFDAADDWIAARAQACDIVVTADLLLADRCLKRGARVLAPDGRVLDENSIGEALAGREIREHLRQMGEIAGGPAPFTRADRSRFLASLEEAVRASVRARGR